MSVIEIKTTWQDQPVSLRLGWDRRLRQFHAHFTLIEEQCGDRAFEPLLLVNATMLRDPPTDIHTLVERIHALGVRVDPRAYEEARDDQLTDAGNKVVAFDEFGRRQVLASG